MEPEVHLSLRPEDPHVAQIGLEHEGNPDHQKPEIHQRA
jgi:hypothetical protein